MPEVNDQEYYKIPDPTSGKIMYMHKVDSAPYFFRGCLDCCFSKGLATVYKDDATQWSFLSILSDEVADAFADWSSVNFDLMACEPLDTEASWVNYSNQEEFENFSLLIFRGNLDMYCMFKYLYTIFLDETPVWEPVFRTLECEFLPQIV